MESDIAAVVMGGAIAEIGQHRGQIMARRAGKAEQFRRHAERALARETARGGGQALDLVGAQDTRPEDAIADGAISVLADRAVARRGDAARRLWRLLLG